RKSFHPPFLLGRKSLNINISDIAAMGGKPAWALLGMGIPRQTSPWWLQEFFEGVASAAREFDVVLIGGDTSRASKLTISITLIGEGNNIILRRGARPGDGVYVSGNLGDAHQGLMILKKEPQPGSKDWRAYFIEKFLDPVPQIALARELSRKKLASSMIDTSDGLSTDLRHLCDESGCGAEIYKNLLPVSSELKKNQKRWSWFALHGGEDYQLLLTVPRQKEETIEKLQKKFPLTRIGRIIREKNIYLVIDKGKKIPLSPKTFRHF
ncbi:MAG: thiamine-phosphate kinase, partial [Acidobacteriota bacterium]